MRRHQQVIRKNADWRHFQTGFSLTFLNTVCVMNTVRLPGLFFLYRENLFLFFSLSLSVSLSICVCVCVSLTHPSASCPTSRNHRVFLFCHQSALSFPRTSKWPYFYCLYFVTLYEIILKLRLAVRQSIRQSVIGLWSLQENWAYFLVAASRRLIMWPSLKNKWHVEDAISP